MEKMELGNRKLLCLNKDYEFGPYKRFVLAIYDTTDGYQFGLLLDRGTNKIGYTDVRRERTAPDVADAIRLCGNTPNANVFIHMPKFATYEFPVLMASNDDIDLLIQEALYLTDDGTERAILETM